MRKTSAQVAENAITAATQHPYYAKKVLHDLTGTRGYDSGYLQGEVDEFVEAFNANNAEGVDEELQDVLFGAQMLAHQVNKRDAPVLGADDKIREFYRRKNYYEKMFKDRNVPFNTDYLAKGSNPLKPRKIQAAFDLAGHQLPAQEAADYSAQYPAFKAANMQKTASQMADTILQKVALQTVLPSDYVGKEWAHFPVSRPGDPSAHMIAIRDKHKNYLFEAPDAENFEDQLEYVKANAPKGSWAMLGRTPNQIHIGKTKKRSWLSKLFGGKDEVGELTDIAELYHVLEKG